MVNVVFVHPDLGIGGAERLIVDAALALQEQGHSVKMFTGHHNPEHCFSETRDGKLSVVVVGDWLPRSVFGVCYALCAYIRMIYVALYVSIFSGEEYDVVLCDQISACIPFLKLKSGKILFYCHFPDQLLTARKSLLKKLYRAPIDWIEEK
ncbi:alpha-1,3/1,6-mannosyltransferase ALG2-like, partial [Anneissia japonica]|uniref:alpha-1,3/1,6-mannosyltransferase ALG2-like n=1 Tax=Anneissia japonica TaxID=1529436 RepID=UPI001425A3A4